MSETRDQRPETRDQSYKLTIEIILWTGVLALFIMMVFRFYTVPLDGDDWAYGIYTMRDIFSLQKGWLPGRHISEISQIISTSVFGRYMGIVVGDMLTGVKIVHGFVAMVFVSLFCIVSSFYLPKTFVTRRRDFLIRLLIIMLLFWFAPRLYGHFNHTSQILGGFVFSLFAWLPFLYYYREDDIPNVLVENPIKTYGIMLVVFYLGTQVMDNNYFVMVSLSMMLVAYLLGQKYFPQFFEETKLTEEKRNVLLISNIMYIVYGFFAFYRNTVLAPSQSSFRAGGRSFDLVVILKRITGGGVFANFGMIIGLLLILYFVYTFIKNKKITRENYFYLSLCVASLFWVLILTSIVRTSFGQSLWLLWICEFSLLLKLYKNNNKIVLLLFPVLLFGMFVNVFRKEYAYLLNIHYFSQDRVLVEYFQEAQRNNLDVVEVPASVTKKYNMRIKDDSKSYHNDRTTKWMKRYGYTDQRIPVIVVED